MTTTTCKQKSTPKDLRFGGWGFIKSSGDLEIWGKNNGERLLYDPEASEIVTKDQETEKK